jgi:hypothetical protein
MREGKGLGRNWWLGAALLAGTTAIVLGARARKRPSIRCAYK